MKKKRGKNRYRRLLPVMLAVLAAGTIGTTYASSKQEVSVDNELEAHSTEVTIEENFPENQTGSNYIKEVQFKNTGTSSVFLRVSYVEYWEKSGTGDAPAAILPNVVTTANGEKELMIKKLGDKEWSKTGVPWDSDESNWTDGGDGWYYYNKILPSKASTPLILDSVVLDQSLKTDPSLSAYFESDTNYHLYFQAEVVQASDSSHTLNSDKVNATATAETWNREATTNVKENKDVTWGPLQDSQN